MMATHFHETGPTFDLVVACMVLVGIFKVLVYFCQSRGILF